MKTHGVYFMGGGFRSKAAPMPKALSDDV